MAVEFEEDRQHYLKQFGITLWYASSKLPNACESNEFCFRHEAELGKKEKGGKREKRETGGLKPGADSSSKRLKTQKNEPDIRQSSRGMLPAMGPRKDMSAVYSELTGEKVSPSPGNAKKEPAASLTSASNNSFIVPGKATNELVNTGIYSSEEVWCRYSASVTHHPHTQNINFLARLTGQGAETERRLFKNILIMILPLEKEPEFDEFHWPPFSQMNIPGQSTAKMFQLLERWMAKYKDGQLVVFNDGSMPGSISGIECPALAQLLSQPQLKQNVWQILRQNGIAGNPEN